MARFRRARRDPLEHGSEPAVESSGRTVEARVPLGRSGEDLLCWVVYSYSAADPLVVRMTVRSPSHALVCERTILRRDLREALRKGASFGGLMIGRPMGRTIPVTFLEGWSSIPVFVPVGTVEAFLAATERLIPPQGDAETAALNDALTSMLDGIRPAPKTPL